MRKIPALLATLALAGIGAAVPAAADASQAAPAYSSGCQKAWSGATPGYFYAYNYDNCSGFLGKAYGNDSNWGDSYGSFRGSDTNRASSILNHGNSTLAVAVYNGTGTDWGGGYTCLARSEYYASRLADDRFSNGIVVDNRISSNRWAPNYQCYHHFVH